jgi:hypothetical protein
VARLLHLPTSGIICRPGACVVSYTSEIWETAGFCVQSLMSNGPVRMWKEVAVA